MKTMQEVKQELLLKEERVSYWEAYGEVQEVDDYDIVGDMIIGVGA